MDAFLSEEDEFTFLKKFEVPLGWKSKWVEKRGFFPFPLWHLLADFPAGEGGGLIGSVSERRKIARRGGGSEGEREDRFLKQPQYLTATAQGCGFGATCFPTLLRPPPTLLPLSLSLSSHVRAHACA